MNMPVRNFAFDNALAPLLLTNPIPASELEVENARKCFLGDLNIEQSEIEVAPAVIEEPLTDEAQDSLFKSILEQLDEVEKD